VLSVGRVILLAVVVSVLYLLFFAVPYGNRDAGEFNPATLAAREIDTWRAVKAKEEFSTYLNMAFQLREQNGYSWFRAAQASYYLARATMAFPRMQNRYERVLPDLESAASIEKHWRNASFDPVAVARAQLTWWVTARMPNANSVDQLTPLIAADYGQRYGIGEGRASDAARRRAQVTHLLDAGPDPDWPAVTSVLTESYAALQRALAAPRRTR
jgi:hypothetical protein